MNAPISVPASSMSDEPTPPGSARPRPTRTVHPQRRGPQHQARQPWGSSSNIHRTPSATGATPPDRLELHAASAARGRPGGPGHGRTCGTPLGSVRHRDQRGHDDLRPRPRGAAGTMPSPTLAWPGSPRAACSRSMPLTGLHTCSSRTPANTLSRGDRSAGIGSQGQVPIRAPSAMACRKWPFRHQIDGAAGEGEPDQVDTPGGDEGAVLGDTAVDLIGLAGTDRGPVDGTGQPASASQDGRSSGRPVGGQPGRDAGPAACGSGGGLAVLHPDAA